MRPETQSNNERNIQRVVDFVHNLVHNVGKQIPFGPFGRQRICCAVQYGAPLAAFSALIDSIFYLQLIINRHGGCAGCRVHDGAGCRRWGGLVS